MERNEDTGLIMNRKIKIYASKYGLVSFRLEWVGMRVVKHRLALVSSYTPGNDENGKNQK